MACACDPLPFPGPETVRLFRQPTIQAPLEGGTEFEAWLRGVEFGFELQRFEWDRLAVIVGAIGAGFLLLKALGR